MSGSRATWNRRGEIARARTRKGWRTWRARRRRVRGGRELMTEVGVVVGHGEPRKSKEKVRLRP